MSTQNIHFTTFGDSQRFKKSVFNITQEAKDSQFFTHIHAYDETNLDQDFLNNHLSFMNSTRGFGYWIWKSQVILQTFEKMNNNDILLYADAGCKINKEGKQRFQEYIDLLNGSPFDNLSFELSYDLSNSKTPNSYPEKMYTKGDLLNLFSIDKNSPQLGATSFFIKKTEFTTKLVQEWLSLSIQNNYHLIDDTPSSIQNEPEFKQHRHDQSLWSILRKYRGTTIVHLDETWYHPNWNNNLNKPIHAIRRLGDKSRL